MRRVIHMAALNVKFENHDFHKPENYVELFNLLHNNRITGKYKRITLGGLKVLGIREHDGEDFIYGEYLRCTDIDTTCSWYDIDEHKQILDEEGNPIQQVENNKKPNYESSVFIFIPNGHRFFYDKKMFPTNSILSPNSMKKLLEVLFSNSIVEEKFGTIQVEVETDEDTIDKIINAPRKKTLFVEFTIPNGDHLSDLSKKVLDRAKSMNLASYNEAYKSIADRELLIDDEAKAKIQIAASNGHVTLKSYDNHGKIAVISTKDYPLETTIEYDENRSTHHNELVNGAFGFFRRLIKRG